MNETIQLWRQCIQIVNFLARVSKKPWDRHSCQHCIWPTYLRATNLQTNHWESEKTINTILVLLKLDKERDVKLLWKPKKAGQTRFLSQCLILGVPNDTLTRQFLGTNNETARCLGCHLSPSSDKRVIGCEPIW